MFATKTPAKFLRGIDNYELDRQRARSSRSLGLRALGTIRDSLRLPYIYRNPPTTSLARFILANLFIHKECNVCPPPQSSLRLAGSSSRLLSDNPDEWKVLLGERRHA